MYITMASAEQEGFKAYFFCTFSVIAVDGKLSPKAGVDLERQYSRLSDDRKMQLRVGPK